MKKFIAVLALIAPILAACTPQAQFGIKEACNGSWAVVQLNGKVRISRLAYGDPTYTVNLSEFGTGQVYLTADLYSLKDNSPLGTATYGPVYVSDISTYGGPVTGPNQYGWVINSTIGGPNGACQASN